MQIRDFALIDCQSAHHQGFSMSHFGAGGSSIVALLGKNHHKFNHILHENRMLNEGIIYLIMARLTSH